MPTAEAAATEEPEIAPKNILVSTLVAARQPGIFPTKNRARRTRRRAMPPLFIMLPASIKNGSASSAKESMPLKHLCATTWASTSVSKPLRSSTTIEEHPILTEIGTPINIRPKKIKNNINAACTTVIVTLPLSQFRFPLSQ